MFTLLLIALRNLSILEFPQEYTFFAIPRLLASFSTLFVWICIIFGVLCRCLQVCQSLVFDGVIGVYRGFTTFLTYCPPLTTMYCSGFASFICDSDFLTFIVFVGFPSFSKPTHTHLKYLIVVYHPWLSYRGTQICAA